MTVARPDASRRQPDSGEGRAGHRHRAPAPPPDLGRSAGRIGYEPALDGLRGLAIAGVMAFHAELTVAGGGFLSVSTFFTLSGFLITTLLVLEHERTGRIALWEFYRRRVRRLMPAALLCLAGIGLVALDSVEFNVGDVITLGGAVFFAIQMAVTAKYGRKMDINVITFWMFVGNGVLSLATSLLFETQAPLSVWTPSFISAMAFLSVGCTCAALLIQNVGLAHVPASTGSLLLSMESPSGVLFSVLLMGEALTSRLLAGFVLIFLSIILSETHFDFLRKKPRPQL